jgi:hypothetical protein
METWSGGDDGGAVKEIWNVCGGGGEDHANRRQQGESRNKGSGNNHQ